jgi:hypothetical protein
LPGLDLAAAGDIGQYLAIQASSPAPYAGAGCRAVRRDAAMTDRILEFLRNRREDGPCLGHDLDVVRDDMLLLPISHESIETGY